MSKKSILVLGGGRHQINLIRYIESAGYPVVVSDYLKNSPGHAIASISGFTDTRDLSANLDLAKIHGIQGIITMGTDQPLVVMAEVARQLDIPCYLTPESARRATDKIAMFEVLSENGVDIPKYVLFAPGDDPDSIVLDLSYPLVAKPCDSQGQRGITVAGNAAQLVESLQIAAEESMTDAIIVQEYLQGPEMTISAWVTSGQAQVMLITDRITYNHPPATGVCLQHIYPSKNITGLEETVSELLARVVYAYQVDEGPLYIQCVRNQDRLYLMEAACRIGGGHEEHLIESVHGFKIHKHLLSLALQGNAPNFPELSPFPIARHNAMVNFMVAHPGTFSSLKEPAEIPESQAGGFYYGSGYQQAPIVNSMGRVGYFVYHHPDYGQMIDGAAQRYNQYAAFDPSGVNLLFWPESAHLNK